MLYQSPFTLVHFKLVVVCSVISRVLVRLTDLLPAHHLALIKTVSVRDGVFFRRHGHPCNFTFVHEGTPDRLFGLFSRRRRIDHLLTF